MNTPAKCSISLQEPDVKYFVNFCLMGGATVTPLDIDIHDPMWPGYCNPSIMWDEKDQNFKMIIRNVNYVLHGATDFTKNWSNWGPVYYSIPVEDGRNLKTQNFIGVNKDPSHEPWEFQLIKTNKYTPIWEFQGEEDARIIRWDNKLYTTGVRRDDNREGRGRMELMHLSENGFQEISRVKVGAVNENSYCEKNWMPIKDMPFHYVQLANPTVVVKTDPKTGKTYEVVHKDRVEGMIDENFDLLRGSSQVVRWGDYWIALVHTCEMWWTSSERKFAKYCHVFVVWDNDWNIIKMSPLFNFANYGVEFTCGLEYHDGKFYIPFAIEDNFVFLMIADENIIRNFIDNDESVKYADTKKNIQSLDKNYMKYLNIFVPPTPTIDNNGIQENLYDVAMWYYERDFKAAAYCILTRSIELFNYTYAERFMAARCIADLGHRDNHEISMWMHTIMYDPNRPEAYMAAAMYHRYRGNHIEALYYARMAISKLKNLNSSDKLIYYDWESIEYLYNKCLFDSQYFESAVEYLRNHGDSIEDSKRVL